MRDREIDTLRSRIERSDYKVDVHAVAEAIVIRMLGPHVSMGPLPMPPLAGEPRRPSDRMFEAG